MIYLAAQVVPGIILRGKPLWPALLAGLVLALINAIVRPILKLITLPLTLLTLGLFLFVLNAFCLWLTSAALLISIVSWALTVFVSDSGRLGRL